MSRIVWLYGYSGSGKTTLAKALIKKLKEEHNLGSLHLDGDEVRKYLSRDLGFSEDDRNEQIRRVCEAAVIAAKQDIYTIVSCITPLSKQRTEIETICKREDVLLDLVYVYTPFYIRKNRDPKGLYKKAMNGEIKNFTGITDRFDVPLSDYLQVSTYNTKDDYNYTVNETLAMLIAEIWPWPNP